MRYYVYDGNGSFYVDDLKEAIGCLEVGIEYASEDGEWADWVTEMFVAEDDGSKVETVARIKQTNLRRRPEILDEDGYDEEGQYWDFGCDSVCDYEVEVL